jgi:hypothetical protein
VNIYLQQFGVSDFSLLKAQFVYSGVLLLMPLAVTALFLASWDWVFHRKQPAPPTEKPAEQAHGRSRFIARLTDWLRKLDLDWASVSAILFSFASTLLVFFLAFVVRLHQRAGDAFSHSWTLDLWATVLVLVADVSRRSWKAIRGRSKQSRTRLQHVVVLLIAMGLIFAFDSYLRRFDDDVYPNVPRQLGGGKPFGGQLILSPGSADTVQHVGLNLAGPDLSEPVTILFEGTQTFLVCLPGTGERYVPCPSKLVVLINKDLIEGLKLPLANQT